jgi:signal transduction histidine kinase
VCVADDGVGIAEHHLARIQEPFYTTKPHGSGLGLAICRSILWGLGGEFAIDSRPGEGTRIRLTLPIKQNGTAATEND